MTREHASYEQIFEALQSDLRIQFRPEFLNRLDDIIIFHPLGEKIIIKIVENLLGNLQKQLAQKKIEIKFSQKLMQFIA